MIAIKPKLNDTKVRKLYHLLYLPFFLFLCSLITITIICVGIKRTKTKKKLISIKKNLRFIINYYEKKYSYFYLCNLSVFMFYFFALLYEKI